MWVAWETVTDPVLLFYTLNDVDNSEKYDYNEDEDGNSSEISEDADAEFAKALQAEYDAKNNKANSPLSTKEAQNLTENDENKAEQDLKENYQKDQIMDGTEEIKLSEDEWQWK